MNQDKEPSKSALKVQQYLLEKGASYEIITLTSSAGTALDAANSLGCEVAQIVKSLLFRTEKSSLPVLALVSGKNRVDEYALEKHLGEKVVKADAEFTKEITGFSIGGIPPVAHKTVIDSIFIDEDLLHFDTLWAAAGTPHTVFKLASKDLEHLTRGRVLRIVIST